MEFRLAISLTKDTNQTIWEGRINFLPDVLPAIILPKDLGPLIPRYFHSELRIFLEDPETQEAFVSQFKIDRLDSQTLWISMPDKKIIRRLEEFLSEIIEKSQLGH